VGFAANSDVAVHVDVVRIQLITGYWPVRRFIRRSLGEGGRHREGGLL